MANGSLDKIALTVYGSPKVFSAKRSSIVNLAVASLQATASVTMGRVHTNIANSNFHEYNFMSISGSISMSISRHLNHYGGMPEVLQTTSNKNIKRDSQHLANIKMNISIFATYKPLQRW